MNYFNNNFNTEQQNNERRVDLKKAKKAFSRIGLAFCTVILVVNVVQIAFMLVLALMNKSNFIETTTGMWILSMVPLYVFAFPVGLLMLRSLSPNTPK